MDVWTQVPYGPAHLTLGERILVASFWLFLAYFWLWMRRRVKPVGLVARVGLPLLIALGVVGSVVELFRSLPIGR